MASSSVTHYSRIHVKYLKVLSQKGFVELARAKRIFEDIKTNFPAESCLEFETALQQINHKLQPFNKQVSVKKHEQFDEDYVVFSTTSAPISSSSLLGQQKWMQPNDYAFFEAVLKLILTSEDYKVRYNVALTTEVNESGAKKKRSLATTTNETLLQSWIQLGYLFSRDRYVCLGPKSLAEFGGSYIQSTFPDLPVCPLCLSITFLKHNCLLCKKIFHKCCLERFWQTKPDTCPTCGHHGGTWGLGHHE